MPILKKSNAVTFLPYDIAIYSASYKNPFYQQYAAGYNTLLIEDEDQSTLYLDGEAYESTSLVPFFEKKPQAFNPARQDISTMYEKNTLFTKYSFANACLQTHSLVTAQNSYNSDNNLGLTNLSKAADLTGNMSTALLQSVIIGGETFTFYLTRHWPRIVSAQNSYDPAEQKIIMVQGTSYENSTAIVEYSVPLDTLDYTSYSTIPGYTFLYIDTVNRYIYFLDNARRNGTATYSHEYFNKVVALKFNIPSQDGVLSFAASPTVLIHNRSTASFVLSPMLARTIQSSIISFCGLDAFNNLVFVEQYNRAAAYPRSATPANKYWLRFHIVKYTSGTPSVTRTVDLSSSWDIGASPSAWAPGHSASMLSYPTKFISDSTTPAIKRSLLVLPQQTYQIAPIVITWNSALDSSNVSTTPFSMAAVNQSNLTYPSGTTSLDYIDIRYDNVVSNASSAYQTIYGFQKAIVTQLAGSTYITFFTSWKYQVNMDVAKTIATRKMNAICYRLTNLETNPVLEYIQSFPIEALDYFLTDSDTTLNVIDNDGISFYSLTPSGWVNTSREIGAFTSIALDSFGRFWATKIAGKNYLQWDQPYSIWLRPFYDPKLELHIIPRTSAYTTSIEFTDTDVEYNGVNINNTLKVNAYNALGQRIATTVLLSIEGPNMEFQVGGTQLQVTTSTIQDTSVPVVITGPGYVNVTASFVI